MESKKWDQVVEDLGPRLYRYFKFKGASDLASDMTQETFIRLFRSIHRYDDSRGPLSAFAIGIAQNVWREHIRKNQPTESLDHYEDYVAEFDLLSELERASQSEKVKKLVLGLSQIQQDVIFFYFDEEMTTLQIAEALEMPEGTIKSHLHRAKEALRNLLKMGNL